MDDWIVHSNPSNILRFILRHSTTQQGLPSLAHDTANLIISTICNNETAATAYTVAGSTIETIASLGSYAAPTATMCRFKEVDATNHPGLYEFQFANARFAVVGATVLKVSVSGAANLRTEAFHVAIIEAFDSEEIADDVEAAIGGRNPASKADWLDPDWN